MGGIVERDPRRWERRRAEQIARQFLERELLPREIADEVATLLENGEPVRALENAVEYRRERS